MYKISEIARKTGLSTATIRYYEQMGLLETKRKANHYREFDDADLDWLTFIDNMKKTGMKLADIRHFSDLKQKGEETRQERLKLLAKQERELIQKRKEIEQSLRFLETTKEITQSC